METLRAISNYEGKKIKVHDGFYLFASIIIISCFMSGNLTVPLIMEMALLFVALFTHAKSIRYINLSRSPFQWWFVITWAFIIINAVFISDYYFGWKTIIIYLLPVLIIVISYKDYDSKTMLKIFLRECVLCDVFLIAYLIINEGPAILSGGTRIGNSGIGVNGTALYLCVFNTVFLYLIMLKGLKSLTPLFVLSVLITILTGSKKGLLALLVAVVVLCISKYKWRFYRYVVPVVGGALLLYVIMHNEYFYSILGRRLTQFVDNIINPKSNNSTGERILFYQLGWGYFKDHIWFGNGRGFFAANSGFGTYSHSNYIEMLVSFGVIGTGIYYSFFVANIIKGLRNIKQQPEAILFICLIVQILVLDSAAITYYSFGMVYFILFIAAQYFKRTSPNTIEANDTRECL